MTRALVALVALALALVAHVPAARADDHAEAEALFRVGEKAFDSAQYAAAADAFEQAYAKLPLPAIAFSLAQANRLQYFIDNEPRHLERAVVLYHAYIDAQKTGGRVADAVANLAAIEPMLRELAHAGATRTQALPPDKATRIVVTADVPGARATIDADSGPVPFIRDVAEGEHAVTVSADGYVTQTHKATAVTGEMVPIEVELVAKPAVLAVRAPAGAYVSIDLRAVGAAPIAGLQVPAGRHIIAVGERGRVPFVRDVDLVRGTTLQLEPTLHATTQRRAARWVLTGGAGLAVATGVAGALAYAAESDAHSQQDKLAAGNADPGVVTKYNQDLASRTSRLHTTEALGGAAGAVLVTGALLFWLDNPTPEAPPRLSPAVSAKSASLMLGGRF